jgi:hypothetical protein
LRLEVTPAEPLESGPHSQTIVLAAVSSRPLPEVGEGELHVLLSASGANAVAAWEQGGKLLYRETSGAAWSGVRTLSLGPSFGLTAALEALQRRITPR